MASVAHPQALFSTISIKKHSGGTTFFGSALPARRTTQRTGERNQLTVVADAGDVSADWTTYLMAGAVAVALLGTAFLSSSLAKTCSRNVTELDS